MWRIVIEKMFNIGYSMLNNQLKKDRSDLQDIDY